MSRLRYRELLLASVFALALTGAAGAADMAVKAPIVAPVPVFSWTGIYLGLSGGTGWGTKEYSYNQDATMNALAAALDDAGVVINGFPITDYVPGPYGQAHSSHDVNGGFFGGQIGANWQAGWAVFGVQAEWYWANLEGKGAGNAGAFTDLPLGLGTTASVHSEVKSFGSVTGRLGAAFDRVLVYAKAGVAWEDADYQVTLHGELLGDCAAFVVRAGGACSQSQTIGQTRTGFTFGTGVELAFDNNWSAFIEYNYYDFGSKSLNYAFDFLTFDAVAVLTDGAYSFGGATLPANVEVTEYLHTIKAGINYKFNWGAPLVARY